MLLYLRILAFVFILVQGLLQAQPIAQKGVMQLSDGDFDQISAVELRGEWLFFPNTWRANIATNTPTVLPVPSDWYNVHTKIHFGTYQLTVSLPKTTEPLYLTIKALRSAGKVWINGRQVGKIGKVGEYFEQEVASAQSLQCALPTDTSIMLLQIEVSNFHHIKAGLLYPLHISTRTHAQQYFLYESITLSFLLGVVLLGVLIHGLLFLYLRSERYLLDFALILSCFGVHILCLATRPMYAWVGDVHWHLAYRIELGTIALSLLLGLKFYVHLFGIEAQIRTVVFWAQVIMLVEVAGIACLPTPLFTYFDVLVSVHFMGVGLAVVYINIKALQEGKEPDIWFLAANVFVFAFILRENFVINRSIAYIEWLHIVLVLYMLAMSLILMRKIAFVVLNEQKIAKDLQATTAKLEFQNTHLESLVKERSQQLMEMKERDMDMLAASHQIKLQLVKNIVTQLESLPKDEKQLSTALQTLINKLKAQNNVEDKLEVLAKDLDRVNAEFYNRLATRFPELSKTERELCAYIKLNMSNKEIAELRNTSLNTINVTRSRLRKKLGLARDEELGAFVQQF